MYVDAVILVANPTYQPSQEWDWKINYLLKQVVQISNKLKKIKK